MPHHANKPPALQCPTVTHRIAILHTKDTLEAWDFCRGVASYRPRSGVWGLHSIPMRSNYAASYLRRLSRTPCDGLIMMPGRSRTLAPLFQRGVKVVEVDGDGDDMPYARLRLDDRYIGRMAAEHLLQRGFTRIVYLGEGSPWSRERLGGLNQAVSDAAGQCYPCMARDWVQLTSRRWIIEQIRAIPRPFAIMGCDDMVAAQAVRAVNSAGWKIPTEVGVIGVDDRITDCIGVQPPLTSVSTERFRIGREAARLLDQQFLGKIDTSQIRRFRPQRVSERESTSIYVHEDPDVAAAIAYIHREACNGVMIDDVARHVHLSRRTLERRFAELVRHSPGEEIRRVRLDAVKHAIERTHLPLAEIAEQCGYPCLSSLSHSFRLATGLSPKEYREKMRSAAGVG